MTRNDKKAQALALLAATQHTVTSVPSGQPWHFLFKFIQWLSNYLLDQVQVPLATRGPLNVALKPCLLMSLQTQEPLQGVVALSLVPFGQVFIGFFSTDKTKALESGTQNLTEAPASPWHLH